MSNYQLKIVPVSKRAARFHPPAFTIMVKELDENGNYVKFAAQDPELIGKINDQIEGMVFEVKRPEPKEGSMRNGVHMDAQVHKKKFGHFPSECGGTRDMCPQKAGF